MKYRQTVNPDMDGIVVSVENVVRLSESTEEMPEDQSGDTVSFYHGGLPSDFTIDNLDVFRPAEKQQKR